MSKESEDKAKKEAEQRIKKEHEATSGQYETKPIDPRSPLTIPEVRNQHPTVAKESNIIEHTTPISQLTLNEPGTNFSLFPHQIAQLSEEDKSRIKQIPPGIARQAKPTGADNPFINTSAPVFKLAPEEKYQASKRYQLQTEYRSKELEHKSKIEQDELEKKFHERLASGEEQKHWLDYFIDYGSFDFQEGNNNNHLETNDPNLPGRITNNSIVDKRQLGFKSRAQIGNRVGDPTEFAAEDCLGETVHNVFPGGTRLEVQTPDKKASIPITIPRSQWTNHNSPDKKRKINLIFPSINPDVHQVELSISVVPYSYPYLNKSDQEINQINQKQTDNPINRNTIVNEEPWEPAVQVFPKSVSSKDILVPLNCKLHIELVHISSEGFRSNPYQLDIILNETNIINPQPLRPSRIGFERLEAVYCMK